MTEKQEYISDHGGDKQVWLTNLYIHECHLKCHGHLQKEVCLLKKQNLSDHRCDRINMAGNVNYL